MKRQSADSPTRSTGCFPSSARTSASPGRCSGWLLIALLGVVGLTACGGKENGSSSSASSSSSPSDAVPPTPGAGEATATDVGEGTLVTGTVEGHRFRTRLLPEQEISVDETLPLLGTTRFPLLDGRTDAEIAFFAQRAEDSIQRFCAIQTEAYRDTAQGRFRRAVVDTVRVGPDLFYVGYFCFDLAAQGHARPGTDIAGLVSLIEEKGARADSIYVGIRLA
ncbi:MAG: hypothetical protein KC729_16455, partial [Candidatus Eisenbacteria bacterium]|nr:hypothetical protein [Candidatus Eisenbacteria bacterium]